jgi:glycosyltransferase involved in cell wall biosynthesis
LKYARAARFIAVSGYVKQALIAGGVAEERISVVHDGVPLLEPSSRNSGAIAVATDDPRKGSALAREAAEAAGVALAFSTDLANSLCHASVFVYITEQEGLGSAALLAMSAAVPVIASRVGGLPEVVEDGVNGLLADNTREAIAACFGRFAAMPDGATAMSRRARQTVEERFTLERMAAGTVRVYEELC